MTGRQKILAVDDSLLICQQIEKVLKNEEYTVYKSHSAKETLELLEEVDPDLILLDVILPDMEGYELFEKIKAKDKNHAPVIFITSKDSEQDVIRGFELGACDYIKKPFRPEELKSRVKAHLEDKRERDELNILNETLKANMQILNRVAYRDELTGLYNRRFVVEKLAQDLMEPNRQDALVMIDVDDFKHVNDCYGHDAFRNAGGVQLLLQRFTEVVILHQDVAELAVIGKPPGIPVLDNTHTETVGIHFLTHIFASLPLTLLFPSPQW